MFMIIRLIRDDVGLREVLPLSIMLSADAVGDWLMIFVYNFVLCQI
jgi:hypothetical protein